MVTLQIEHPVRDFASWKTAFDTYNAFRAESRVHRYQICRLIDDPNHVIINLDFAHVSEADTFLATMRQLWDRVEGKLIDRPQARMIEVLEAKEYNNGKENGRLAQLFVSL